MFTLRSSFLLAVAGATALAFAPVGTADEDGGVTADLSIASAEVVDGVLDLDGTFDFGGAVDMGEDAAGDATVANAGLDLANVTLEQTGDRLRVELRVHDATPAVGVPDVSRYWVPLAASSLAADAELHVWTSAAFQGAVAEPFTSFDFTSGESEFSSTPVAGGLTEDGNGFFWDVSLSEVGLSAFDRIDFPTATTGTGVVGFGKLNGGATEHDSYQGFEKFALGGDIALEVLDAAGDVVISDLTLVGGDGSFDGAIDVSGLSAGDYELRATGDYADVVTAATAPFSIG